MGAGQASEWITKFSAESGVMLTTVTTVKLQHILLKCHHLSMFSKKSFPRANKDDLTPSPEASL